MKVTGDQLTYAAVLDPKLAKHFRCFIPTFMFIDRATGYFNEAMGFKKDYAAVLSSFWDIDTAINNYIVDPNEVTDFNLMDLGIHIHDMEPEDYEKLKYLYDKMHKAPKDWNYRNMVLGSDEDLWSMFDVR